MEGLNINDNTVTFYKNVVMYIKYVIENFDINKFNVNLIKNVGFSLTYSYSFDGQNYSTPVSKDKFNIDSDYKNVYVAVHFTLTDPNESTTAVSFYGQRNVDPTRQVFTIESVVYNKETRFDVTKADDVRFESKIKVVDRFPKWNFYDDQQRVIDRWLDQCDAMAEMYGHTCIYFKTEPVESQTVHTFANHVFRNVVAIKRLKINVPNNELPQDRSAYTDWDFMMQDDFVVHVVNRKFKLAFGDDKVPLSKDYLYLPVTRKLYRVNAVQAKNGFMNVIGWWECFLVKYEEDECVVMSDAIKESLKSTDQEINQYYDEATRAVEDTIPEEEIDNLHDILGELDVFKSERLYDENLVNKETTNEKKEVTQWYTNKAVDSTGFVSLKETEHQREMINERVQIVNVNPDKNTYPVTMYDCTTIDKGNVGMIYDLIDYTSVNKQSTSLEIESTIDMAFNVVFRSRYSGEMFVFVDEKNNNPVIITRQRKALQVTINGEQIMIDHDFDLNEFYNITLQINNTQLTCMIFKLDNKQKTLLFKNVYKIMNFPTGITLYKMLLMGGQTLVNDIYLYVNGKVVLKDNVNPVMVMRKFD